MLAVHLLGVDRIAVIAHTRCKMTEATDAELRDEITALAGAPADGWDVPRRRATSSRRCAPTSRDLRACPLVPASVELGGFVYDVDTGRAAARGRRREGPLVPARPAATPARCCPTAPDAHRRAPDHDYLAQVAVACDRLGFDGMLTPCGTGCEDAWLSTASLLPLTRRVKFLVAFRPALLTPTLAAQMASTYQRMSRGRLLVNIVTGAEPAELARFGVHDDKDTRYAQTAEFLQVLRGAWSGAPFDFDGSLLRRRGRDHPCRARPGPRRLLRRRVRRGRGGRGRARRRVPRVG